RNKMKLRQKMEPKTKTSTKPKAAEGKKVLPKWNVDEGNKKLNYNPESKPEYDDNQTYEAGETKIDDISWIKADDEPASKSLLGNLFSKLTGNKVIQAEDLTDSMETFRQHLITKNVASDIATKLCESVATSLQGQKYPSLSSIKTVIRPAMQSALVRILTPRRHIDILRDALEAKKNKKPYTITFVGVNGVGKSTNLAKVCSYLQQNGLSVMMAACDTFRSGAVEQLKTHARRLKVEVYEKGYQSDATSIACDAIKHAKNNNINVVLIDTAGRMQDNAPLMMSLSQLVNTALPDLVLFVGEALVGNDAVDQLTKFNQALIDLSKDKNPRTIDGIILTKFDTIDDKVGAAISMVYSTGAPIVFLGVGQSYTDSTAGTLKIGSLWIDQSTAPIVESTVEFEINRNRNRNIRCFQLKQQQDKMTYPPPAWLLHARLRYSQRLPSISEIEKLSYRRLKKHPTNTDLRRCLLAVDFRHAAFSASAYIPPDQFINSLNFGRCYPKNKNMWNCPHEPGSALFDRTLLRL
ncbi:hypothetical protein PROFUN_16579, partial [Planoprotostelium fungivorum]